MTIKKNIGLSTLHYVEYFVLGIIAVATIVAIGQEIEVMVDHGRVALADLLLLFIFLEVLAMVSIYVRSGQLPVRLPLYIGMVALARYLILDMKDMSSWRIMAISGGVLLLAIAVLIIRYGHSRYPYDGQSVADD